LSKRISQTYEQTFLDLNQLYRVRELFKLLSSYKIRNDIYMKILINIGLTFYVPGFNVETVEYKNVSFTVWDVGGQDKV
jgi:hypothetical protein